MLIISPPGPRASDGNPRFCNLLQSLPYRRALRLVSIMVHLHQRLRMHHRKRLQRWRNLLSHRNLLSKSCLRRAANFNLQAVLKQNVHPLLLLLARYLRHLRSRATIAPKSRSHLMYNGNSLSYSVTQLVTFQNPVLSNYIIDSQPHIHKLIARYHPMYLPDHALLRAPLSSQRLHQ